MKNKYVYGTQNYKYLIDELCNNNGFIKGEINIKRFLDDEIYYKLNLNHIENQDVILIAGTASSQDVLELFDLGSAIVKYGAKTLTIFCPYFGWSTMERTVKEGEIVTAKTRARLISAIPKAKEGNKIILFDLHSEGIPYYFEGDIVAQHIYGKEIIKDVIFNDIKADNSFMLASTDAGRAKWVESLGNEFKLNTAFVYKKRNDDNSISLAGINADVVDKNIIIYDDMIRSGSSLINAAKAYKNNGAKDIYVITTHGLFLKGTNENGKLVDSEKLLEHSGLFKCIYSTNSYYKTQLINNKNIKIKSIIPLFKEILKK